jgi:hypothetical protein
MIHGLMANGVYSFFHCYKAQHHSGRFCILAEEVMFLSIRYDTTANNRTGILLLAFFFFT